jgi:hypothetical protein
MSEPVRGERIRRIVPAKIHFLPHFSDQNAAVKLIGVNPLRNFGQWWGENRENSGHILPIPPHRCGRRSPV